MKTRPMKLRDLQNSRRTLIVKSLKNVLTEDEHNQLHELDNKLQHIYSKWMDLAEIPDDIPPEHIARKIWVDIAK